MNGQPPTTFDFYPFAGLHRPVVLTAVPQDAIEDVTVVTGIDGADGWVQVRVRAGGRPSGKVTLTGDEQRADADLAFSQGVAEARLAVPDARLWSDTTPYLYDLDVFTESDHYALKVGIRTVAVEGGQLLLNGQPVRLRGFGRHEDFPASGRGLNVPLMVKDTQLMRWTGANSYRTSHYPYSEEEMRLADEEGFLIIDETPAVGLQFDDVARMDARYSICLQQIEALISRDKNHPSVVMWSVANEPQPADMVARLAGRETGPGPLAQASRRFLSGLVAHARRLDPTRPITFAGAMGTPIEWAASCDVVSINRYWGWYVAGAELDKGLAIFDKELDALWEALGKPIVVTEFGAGALSGLHGHPAVMWTEEYQAALIRGYLTVAAGKPYVAGMHVWNFADFAAAQSVLRVGGMNMKGVFTRTRRPKMAAQVLREFWVP